LNKRAEVILGIFQKDLGVKGLDYKFVKESSKSFHDKEKIVVVAENRSFDD
jgi:hypothetical protein